MVSVSQLDNVQVNHHLKCQNFQWKDEMLDTPVFRQPVQVGKGMRTSPDRACNLHHHSRYE